MLLDFAVLAAIIFGAPVASYAITGPVMAVWDSLRPAVNPE